MSNTEKKTVYVFHTHVDEVDATTFHLYNVQGRFVVNHHLTVGTKVKIIVEPEDPPWDGKTTVDKVTDAQS